MKTIGLLLSSGIIALAVSSFVSIYLSRLGYRQKYYERIIDKRMSAHDQLQSFVTSLKLSVKDQNLVDPRSYHNIFSDRESFYRAYAKLATLNDSFWVSDRTRKAIIDLNRQFFRCNALIEKNGDIVEVGKQEYKEIASIRDDLEESLLFELPTLHRIEKFLKSKSVERDIVTEDLKLRPSEKKS